MGDLASGGFWRVVSLHPSIARLLYFVHRHLIGRPFAIPPLTPQQRKRAVGGVRRCETEARDYQRVKSAILKRAARAPQQSYGPGRAASAMILYRVWGTVCDSLWAVGPQTRRT